MKATLTVLFALFLLSLSACSGSDVYRGKWLAMTTAGARCEIVFDEKRLSITDSSGRKQDYTYTQNAIRIQNGISTYGIRLSDGRGYEITFPKAGDKSVGLIRDPQGPAVYTIGRKAYVPYDSLYQLQ